MPQTQKNRSQELEILSFASQQDWQAWLALEHQREAGVWLKLAKKNSQFTTLSYQEALEAALCWGWIDGQKKACDSDFWLQKFTPRRAKSIWSQINKDKALALMAAGKMQPAGLREIEKAQANGRWQAAYTSAAQSEVPEDLSRALQAQPEALAFFESLNRQNRYAILFRIHNAKKPQTRAQRIETFVAMLARHEKIYP
ncbi:bacteriocin-protection protein [bacterium (Candidatus Blackallbacteria) CG17_big_fil_post_rev_8_21_14_2_50_48_46]|uniref:Bacteriocin-protection protein n=1 Tax=bacterium (Candidatus Blackallbacteria) CG17_big_fil_post_rev_8_21_14_2_50_48_46 TaxID=2014261 RepID=A0A2M7G532_9BACT|nr:MAG: bacteriocin-protection protein [bacterium (Candidatus Blackallbacteria) CG18_big_fil_WC_8_21_14_2_50_49_26]PIW16644.1 MAG: bacteriocin-protection protein [bacterium (Candidatus Blackallbacteria) CG17_big_fil_post_rev_8_21_14_2_50_48_46]PIW46151.1 MAG: bacteriocin-protection protein [bacterium (Candidatus Blackallbacteria) CG13_big_fil_rev_8_21_14_2_50_49_14]